MKFEKKLNARLHSFEDNVMPRVYEWVENRKPLLLRMLLKLSIRIIGFAILIVTIACSLLLRPWFRICLYIFFACYTKFIFEPAQIEWEEVGSRAQAWAIAGAALGVMANLPYFIFLRLSNSGNFFLDYPLSVIDETLSSNKSKVEKKPSPWLTILFLSITGYVLGAITVLFRQFHLQNVLAIIMLICVDLIATAIIRKLFGKKQSTATKREVLWLGFNEDQFRFMKNMTVGIVPVSWKEMDDGKRYEVYRSNTKAIALEFLNSISTTEIPKLFHIIVETPQGNVGKNTEGVFDEP